MWVVICEMLSGFCFFITVYLNSRYRKCGKYFSIRAIFVVLLIIAIRFTQIILLRAAMLANNVDSFLLIHAVVLLGFLVASGVLGYRLACRYHGGKA